MASLCLTLDLLSLPVYGAVHDVPVRGSRFSPYEKPLQRFLELMGALGARSTLFATGLDLLQPKARERAREALAQEHELASQGHEHDFVLSSRSEERIRLDLRTSIDTIREAVGRVPRGFRAPGYSTSNRLLDALEHAGFYWDSSVYPSPLFYGAKAAMLATYNLLNRTPALLFDTPRVLSAPREPYRPGTAFRRGRRALFELPVADPYGAPLNGHLLSSLSDSLVERLAALTKRREHLVIAFHAMELADPDDVPSALALHHPVLANPWRERQRALQRALALFADGRALLTCSELVARLT